MEEPAVPVIDVVHYDARVQPDFAAKTIRGSVAISFVAQGRSRDSGRVRQRRFDDRLGGRARNTPALQPGRSLRVRIRAVPTRRSGRDAYGRHPCTTGPPQRHSVLSGARPGLHGVFHESMDGVRRLAGRQGDASLARGRARRSDRRRQRAADRARTRLRGHGRTRVAQTIGRRPHTPSGSRAGRFVEMDETRGRVRLRYLADGFSEPELRRIFRDTPDMLGFFEDRAGVPYPEATYTQVLDGRGHRPGDERLCRTARGVRTRVLGDNPGHARGARARPSVVGGTRSRAGIGPTSG